MTIHVGTDGDRPLDRDDATVEAERVLARLGAWAARLTRFSPDSDLAALNGHQGPRSTVRPTLCAVLGWAGEATRLTDGIVDVTLLDERIAAEVGLQRVPSQPARAGLALGDRRSRWTLAPGPRLSYVERDAAVRFDLDGVAKGWLADRALGLLRRRPFAVVDADGDIAARIPGDAALTVAIAHPFDPRAAVAHVELAARGACDRLGVATSGTTVHRWRHGARPTHHLIDPRSGRSAVTDVVQATAVAGSAREAETWSKTAVILGSDAALPVLDSNGIGVVLVTDSGDLLATPDMLQWLR